MFRTYYVLKISGGCKYFIGWGNQVTYVWFKDLRKKGDLTFKQRTTENTLDSLQHKTNHIRTCLFKNVDLQYLFENLYICSGLELKLKGLVGSQERWEKLEDLKIFWFKKTAMSGIVVLNIYAVI